MKMYKVSKIKNGKETEKVMTESEFKKSVNYDVVDSWNAYEDFVNELEKLNIDEKANTNIISSNPFDMLSSSVPQL